MSFANPADRVLAEADIRTYFQSSVDAAIVAQGVEANVETSFYLVNLLTSFIHTENLYTRTPDGLQFTPLVALYSEALAARSGAERSRTMRRMGDVALFVAGVFSYSLNRKLVDVDYYIAMGGNAYAWLSSRHHEGVAGSAFGEIFTELATKFRDFVDVLSQVAESQSRESDRDILRLYELWIRTGSPRAQKKLRELGIDPIANLNAGFEC